MGDGEGCFSLGALKWHRGCALRCACIFNHVDSALHANCVCATRWGLKCSRHLSRECVPLLFSLTQRHFWLLISVLWRPECETSDVRACGYDRMVNAVVMVLCGCVLEVHHSNSRVL